MIKRDVMSNGIIPRLMNTDELRVYTGLGRDNAKKLGKRIGACVRIGNRTLWDRKKVDQYFDSLSEERDDNE